MGTELRWTAYWLAYWRSSCLSAGTPLRFFNFINYSSSQHQDESVDWIGATYDIDLIATLLGKHNLLFRLKLTMPKATTPTQARRRGLEEEYLVGSGILKNRPGKSKSKSQRDEEEERENNFVDARASRKILDIGRQLAEEDAPARRADPAAATAFGFGSRYEDGAEGESYDDDEIWADDDDEIIETIDVDPDDLQTFQQFLPSSFDDPLLTEGPWATKTQEPADEEQGTSTNLADLVSQGHF